MANFANHYLPTHYSVLCSVRTVSPFKKRLRLTVPPETRIPSAWHKSWPSGNPKWWLKNLRHIQDYKRKKKIKGDGATLAPSLSSTKVHLPSLNIIKPTRCPKNDKETSREGKQGFLILRIIGSNSFPKLRPTPPPGVPAPFSSSEAAAIFRSRRITAVPRRPLATLLCSLSHRHRPGPEREARAWACGVGGFSVTKAQLRPRPRCPGAGSLCGPARAGGQQGGRSGSTGRSGPGGGWDLKVPSHLLPVLGPGTLEEPGWRLQKIPGWRKQPRARVAAAGVSERNQPPEMELRPRPAPQPPHAPPPVLLSLGAALRANCWRHFRLSWSAKKDPGLLKQQPGSVWCWLVVRLFSSYEIWVRTIPLLMYKGGPFGGPNCGPSGLVGNWASRSEPSLIMIRGSWTEGAAGRNGLKAGPGCGRQPGIVRLALPTWSALP